MIMKTILNKKNSVGGISMYNFRLYYRTIVIKNSITLVKKNKQVSGIENLNIISC